MTEEQLRIMFDIKVIVKNALEQLKEGEFWMDQDFVKRFGLHGKPGMRQALESIEAKRIVADWKYFSDKLKTVYLP